MKSPKKRSPLTIRRYTKVTRNPPSRRKNGAAGPQKRTGTWNGNTAKKCYRVAILLSNLTRRPYKIRIRRKW